LVALDGAIARAQVKAEGAEATRCSSPVLAVTMFSILDALSENEQTLQAIVFSKKWADCDVAHIRNIFYSVEKMGV
jgi:hypothetical protein